MPRLAANYEVVQAATALNASGGTTLVVALNNNNWALLVSILATYVASASVGNRVPIIQVKDATGLILWPTTRGVNITAGLTTYLAAGGGVPSLTLTPIHTMPLPDNMIVPPLSTVTIFDNTAVDAADTVAANILLSY